MIAETFVEEPENASVKSARRVLQILELFSRERRQMATTDVALQLDLPVSSTAALLKSLASQGYLVFDPRSRIYSASLRVGFLGGWMHKRSEGFSRLDGAIESLANKTGQTVILGTRNDVNILYVQVEARASNLHFYLPVGSRQRLVDTTMGRVLLAAEDDRAIESLVRRANAERTDNRAQVDLATVQAEIEQVRSLGHTFSVRAFFEGAAVAAVPLKISDTGQTAVLGIGGRAEEIIPQRDRLIALICAAVQEIEAPCPSDVVRPERTEVMRSA